MICRKESKNEVKTFTIFSRYSHLRYLHAQKRVTIERTYRKTRTEDKYANVIFYQYCTQKTVFA